MDVKLMMDKQREYICHKECLQQILQNTVGDIVYFRSIEVALPSSPCLSLICGSALYKDMNI